MFVYVFDTIQFKGKYSTIVLRSEMTSPGKISVNRTINLTRGVTTLTSVATGSEIEQVLFPCRIYSLSHMCCPKERSIKQLPASYGILSKKLPVGQRIRDRIYL